VAIAACSCKAGRLSQCESLKSPADRNACYQRKAHELRSHGLCFRLTEPERQADCLTGFADQGDVTACEEADAIYPVPGCWRRIAVLTEKVEMCDRIADFEARVLCVKALARDTRDPKSCQHIKAPKDRDDCTAEVADKARDVAMCDGIENPFRRDLCRVDKGFTYFGGTSCDRIEGIRRRDSCYLAVVNDFWKSTRRSDGPPDGCGKVVKRRTRCLLDLAKGRPETCEQVGAGPDSIARRLCYDDAFEGYGLPCARIPEPAVRQACEARAAIPLATSETCAAMTNSDDADDCWDAVARTDAAACLHIKQPDFQSTCVRKNWARSKSAEVCRLLRPISLSQVCAERLGAEIRAKGR
jgi:hypothetical protein